MSCSRYLVSFAVKGNQNGPAGGGLFLGRVRRRAETYSAVRDTCSRNRAALQPDSEKALA